ncbi:hypothetical protein KIW84_054320 [Lathyrus oleraceus]|uniref:Uncharacterized protein n=1 Tax=Pisum sativum TaxID=3888 RepID=A0A9D5AJY9_PEA|nr:hypothetical protein KIW84_054320 [Pisum sativum]
MATSIASQLETIRSITHVDFAPLKRPFTRPSILLDPKEVADIILESVCTIALQELVSGFFSMPLSTLQMLEYLIRGHKIHVCNSDDLILCASPYHGKRAFVQGLLQPLMVIGVKRIKLLWASSGVQGISDNKASTLMIVGLHGNKVALASKYLNI